ncbi:MAG: hypothetical protein ABWZ88_16685 [Variovorax sp.]
MNPQWNTPPNGDFAALVERLATEAASPKRPASEQAHVLDVGMTPSSTGAPGSVPARPTVAARLSSWIGRAVREWVDRQLARQPKERRNK